jgi:hypothetical protein
MKIKKILRFCHTELVEVPATRGLRQAQPDIFDKIIFMNKP